ncbi:AzlC family ABC transporter permease [Chitinolyticbacter meiyuanensis]|uniref:AzlC family ABC transporter permease n=1 Tax=Chitinolyticbacter meiyuanensis TaxID=682798 RepID=UPI001FEB27DF|nr:AzlC family ABC transporter permease [Chitinolyticbacter meiyuanensis]
MPASSIPRAGFWSGMRDMAPMLIGAAPFGLIFGTLSVTAGMPAWAAIAMSLVVFAGASQFIAVTLVAASAAPWLIIATTFIVNLRHALYAASLWQQVMHWPRWRRALGAFVLTDECFAIVYHKANSGEPVDMPRYYFGAGFAMYVNWCAFTLIGIVLGRAVPGIEHWGLEFAMAATFVGIVVPLLKGRPQVGAALAAGIVALAAHALPYKLGLMLGAVAGIAVGVWLEKERA